MSRVVVGKVDWARPCTKPSSIPASRPRGRKADGLRYEKLCAKAMPEARHGEWYEFYDINGRGWCQPDLLIITLNAVIVLECKLSNYFEGYKQIERLYKPVLQAAWSKPVVGAVIMKSLRSDAPAKLICPSMNDALALLRQDRTCVPIIHWLGRANSLLCPWPEPERRRA